MSKKSKVVCENTNTFNDNGIEERKILKSVKLFIVLLFLVSTFACLSPILNTYSRYISQVTGSVTGEIAKPIVYVDLDKNDKILKTNQNIIWEQPFSVRNYQDSQISDTAFDYKLIFSLSGVEDCEYQITLKDVDTNREYNIINNTSETLHIGIETSIIQNYLAIIKFTKVSTDMQSRNFDININVDAQQAEL